MFLVQKNKQTLQCVYFYIDAIEVSLVVFFFYFFAFKYFFSLHRILNNNKIQELRNGSFFGLSALEKL